MYFWILRHWYSGSQTISSACMFRCNDVMFQSFQLPQGWRHSSEHKCKKGLSITVWSTFRHNNALKWDMIQILVSDRGCQCHRVCHRVAASYVSCRVMNVGGLSGMTGREDGWMEVDSPALRLTCCLSNTLIRFRSEWTWHCDIKEFHSLHVSSAPYSINMPLVLHSDSGCYGAQNP